MMSCRIEHRFQAVVLRSRFDEHKDEKDFMKARKLLIDGCREMWERRDMYMHKFIGNCLESFWRDIRTLVAAWRIHSVLDCRL